MLANCNNSTINIYSEPLDEAKIKHLYRRIGYGISIEDLRSKLNSSASVLIDEIVDIAVNANGLQVPYYANYDVNDYPSGGGTNNTLRIQDYENLKENYIQFIFETDLLGKLSFFWTNHLVTDYTSHFWNAYQWEYIDCIIRNSLGNYKTFISEIGLTNAMLFYLDGAESQRDNPNENYARELYELFTLGEGNGYTEQDIVETSRALTGYWRAGNNYVQGQKLTFNANYFDSSEKTIFGRTGNWDYFDVIDILFEEKAPFIATFVCTKLYEFFVHPESEGTQAQLIIEELSNTFLNNNFEIAPVIRQLLKSEHFFDSTSKGVQIKSPYDLFLMTIKEFDTPLQDVMYKVQQGTRSSGQTIFSPPDVAGWQRNRAWINSSYVISRWTFSESIVNGIHNDDTEYLRSLALLIAPNLGLTSNNPDLISRKIIDFFLINGLHSEEDYAAAYMVFRGDVSDTYFEGGETPIWTLATWPSASTQLYNLISYLVKEPEYQLT